MLDPNSTLVIDNKKTKKKKSKSSDTAESENRKILLRSIAAFLGINGFEKTLSMLRSEAQIEFDGPCETSIDIEELICKFLESSQGHEGAAIDWRKETDTQFTDSQKSDSAKKQEIEQHHNAYTYTQKKRRKHRIEADDDVNPAAEENELDNKSNEVNGLEKLKSVKDLGTEIKDKKKKKKSQSVSLEENPDKNLLVVSCGIVENGDHENILPNIDVNDRAKKKKKHKMSADGRNENTKSEEYHKIQEIIEENVAEQNSLTNTSSTPPVESNANNKGEKKRKRKAEATLASLAGNGEEHAKQACVESESTKEKAAASKNDDTTDVKAHKKRKRLESEEKAVHDENGTTTIQEQDPSAQDVQKEQSARQSAKGDFAKNESEGGTYPKSKKRRQDSAEPKTVNAFQRVKIDEVKFADEKLQDNSYWALDATGSGYGAKAQEVLGQVRGRGFRHEKTKKKRGTYRGGQIDLQSHSIKFNYSDEE